MRCNCPTCGKPLDFSDLRVDFESGIIVGNGRFASLTVKEMAMFELLHAKPGRTLSKAQLLDGMYALLAGDGPLEKIIDVYICKIRKKLRDVGVTIETVWGIGYRLKREGL